MRVILIGFMGSGKTTVSKILGDRLGIAVHDLDQIIVDWEKESIPHIFQTKGEAYFRQLEFEMLQRQRQFSGVLATGGGTIINDNCAELIKTFKAPIILLEVADNNIGQRLRQEGGRPIANLKTDAELIELKHQRNHRYHALANYVVQTDRKTPNEVADEIMAYLHKK